MSKIEEEGEDKTNDKLIRIFVLPEINTNEFQEVSPAQLDEYLKACTNKQCCPRKRKRNMYHQLALVAKVDVSTTENELDRLLRSEVRTLLVQTNCNKPRDLEQIALKINTCIDKLYMEREYRTPIGIAVELNGELLTSGRMRNDERPDVGCGHIMVLTTNEDYKYCCFKEIIYVSNLWRYIAVFQLNDVVTFGDDEIMAKVVKCGTMRPLTLEVIKGGCLSSYMNLRIPYYVETKQLANKDILDIEGAIKMGAHLLVIPEIRSPTYLHAIREAVDESIQIVGSIDYMYMDSKFMDVSDSVLELDAVWIEKPFCPSSQKRLASVIAQCGKFDKAVLGTVPLKVCSDFKRLENNSLIKQMDGLFIEKSPLQEKYPLIAKQLLPVSKKSIEVPPLQELSCKEGIVKFVLRTIYSIRCQGIVVSNACPNASLAFAIPVIYCPVIAIVKDDIMARRFNLRRNLKSLIYDGPYPLDYGIAFARSEGFFTTGDFIICISDSLDENSQICVNLRAYYLP